MSIKSVYIMTDIEGISGVYCREQSMTSGPRYAEGKKFMTRDINIVANACKAAGVEKVYVHDCHSVSCSVIWDQLSDDIDYMISGRVAKGRYADIINECDAVILLGYHAMAGTDMGMLNHTYNGMLYENVWLNDKKIGEIGVDAAIAGEKGIPVIMVSGDDYACKEAREFIPGVVTAEVKKATSEVGALLLPPAKAEQVLREKTKEALAKVKEIKPIECITPVEFKVELVQRNTATHLGNGKPYFTQIDGRTYKVTADSVEEGYYRFNA